MKKNIFSIPTLFLLSGLIALFLMPGEMLNAKTKAQLIKEAAAALVKAERRYRAVNAQYNKAHNNYIISKSRYEKVKKYYESAKYAYDNAKTELARVKKGLLPKISEQPAAGTWVRLPGAGLDIGIGSKGDAWLVGLERALYRWNGKAWQGFPKKAWGGFPGYRSSKIDVDYKGRVWVVNTDGKMYWISKSKHWILLPGKGIDIACGGQGVVWCVGDGKNYAYRWNWNGRTWQKLSGPDVRRIDVDNRGYAWVVNKNNDIFAFDGKVFRHKPGKAIDIACGPGGSIWVLGMDKTVWKWNGRGWTRGNGMGYHITIDNDGLPWVIGMDKYTWRRTK
ncbi:tectonin domain-containing protein [Candidatus Riflebacteria bacterium]